MLQQPVAKELRSFKSLSKFSGAPQKRNLTQRRQSAGLARKQSQTRRKRNDSSLNEDSEGMDSIGPGPSSISDSLTAGAKPGLGLGSSVSRTYSVAAPTSHEGDHNAYQSSGKRVSLPLASLTTGKMPSTSAIDLWLSRHGLDKDIGEEEDKGGGSMPTSNRRQTTQVEWNEQADFIEQQQGDEEDEDEESDLPYPGQSQPPRSWALQMVTNPWFDRLTMGVIILNCITLGMYRPCEDGADCHTYRCFVLSMVDHLIFAYFAAEMVVKVVALGFYGDAAYLSDTWNRLDFFIVVAGVAEYLLQEYLGNINLTAIRTIRVLRPLRAVNRIPSMRILVNLLLDTLPMLGNVLLLCFFVFFIFGIVGVQLWAGLLRNRCVINLPRTYLTENLTDMAFEDVSLTRYYIPQETSLDYICSQPDSSGIHTCQNLPPYTHNGIKCNLTLEQYAQVTNESCINWNIYYNECRVMHKNPFQGSVSFDNIGFAWVAIFLVISLEGWTDIMYYVQDAHSFWNWIYFVLLIVIGAFFMINLCLVVIATQFAETKRRETERMLQERRRMRSHGSLTSSDQGGVNSSKDGGGDSVYAAFVRFVGQMSRRTKRYVVRRYELYRANAANKKLDAASKENNAAKPWTLTNTNSATESSALFDDASASPLKRLASASSIDSSDGETIDRIKKQNGRMESTHNRSTSLNTGAELVKTKKKKISRLTFFRNKVKKFVVCDHFTRGILVAILVNTLSMGVEYHQQPEILTIILEYSNYFFTALFALEMLLKVIADGLFGYLADGFNLFDGGIVALSVLELFQEGKGGLSVLRTFRLLRILKLVRFMPALRYQLVVMLRTMDNVTVFFGLLVLFIFIFSILGMNLFGCRFCKMEDNQMGIPVKRCERKNFDSLLWALITVFQILTQEDWNMVLFNGMSQTTPWAALYFVALMTFGNYVLFNLLVAILVEGFQESKEEERRLLVGIALPQKNSRRRGSTQKADEEEKERKNELEMLIAKTTSPSYMQTQESDSVSTCTCGAANLSSVRQQLEGRPRTDSTAGLEYLTPLNSNRSTRRRSEMVGRFHQPLYTGQTPPCYPSRTIGLCAFKTVYLLYLRTHFHTRNLMPEDNQHQSKMQRLNRHKSLFMPDTQDSLLYNGPGSESVKSDGLPKSSTRQRMNSWCGLHGGHGMHSSLFNPYCPMHGRRALLEAYARENLSRAIVDLQKNYSTEFVRRILTAASQELQQALMEEERRAEELKNTSLRRFIRKTCLHSRSDCSLFLFSPKNRIRLKCIKLTQRKWFDYTVLMFIGINCVTLAMERPSIPPGSPERMFLTTAGYVFTLIFTVEMSLKVIANGCFLGEGAYFKDGWNILDGVLVIISLINVLMEFFVSGDSPKIFGVIRVLRLLRALRPLRVINRAPGVKLVVMTLISSLKPIGNIVLICCTFFIIFGILGVQLFKGMMYHCVGADVSNVTTKADCLSADKKNRWINHRYNFDNLGQALMSLFVLSSKDGWVSIMYQGIDAVGVDMQPYENFNEWRMIYFISFLLLVGFFVLNMFAKRLERKVKRQLYEDKYGPQLKKKDKEKKPALPYWHHYGPLDFNVISMAMEFYMMPLGLKYILRALNYFFTAVFTLEAGMKLYALGFRKFFEESDSQLDFFIVILSVFGIIFEEFEALELPINPTIIRVMRVLRIARVLKLLKMAKGIRSLLDTVGEALPQVGNLGSLFFLLFFIFAALGVELFGKLECSEEHPCDGLGEHAHFKNFGMAFLTLFRIATGDNWNGIMKDALRDDCDPSDHCERNCCVDPILAPCFFVIFVLISQFVLVNVVVAVLMKHLEESNKRDELAEASANAVGTVAEVEVNQTETDAEDAEEEDLQPPEQISLANVEKDLLEVEEELVEESRRDGSISNEAIHIYDVTPELSLASTTYRQPRRLSSPSNSNPNPNVRGRCQEPVIGWKSSSGSPDISR
uniref:Ion transport domain-containing protein n=1 Tax=Ditylenchus dipsaci TaxID=166011 RepID=A0A915CTA5_9BILA